MQESIIYLLKSAGLMSLFFAAYFFLLKNDTSFKANRVFLLAGIITAILLPFIEITRIVVAESTATPIFLDDFSTVPDSAVSNYATQTDWWQIGGIVYFTGLGFFLLKFLIDLFSLLKLIFTHKTFKEGDFYIIRKSGNTQPFSFFKFIVIDPQQHTPVELEMILRHERCHARQWHSFDHLLSSLSVYLLWFNPLAWLYRKSVVQNLEYLADQEVIAAQVSKKEYQKTLLKISVANFQPALTNQFYQSLIKKRIMMLNKNATQKANLWKVGLVLPFICMFMITFSVKTKAQVRDAEVVGVSYSFSPSTHFAVITKNATDKDLEKLKKDFSENGITVEFTQVERSSKGEITKIAISYENEQTGNTGSFSQSETGGIPTFTMILKEESISFKTGSETSILGDKASYFHEKIAEKPLIIISGKEYKKDNLNGKTVWIKGEMNVLNASEASLKYGNRGKDGIIIVSEGEILDDYNAHLKTIDSEGKDVNRKYIWVREGQKPLFATLVNREKKIIPDADNIIAIQQDNKRSRIMVQETKPLIIIEGEVKEENFDVSTVDPSTIKSLSVLKGENAVEKYGKRAKDGAVEIDLKSEEEQEDSGASSAKSTKSFTIGVGSTQSKNTEKKKSSTVSIIGSEGGTSISQDFLYVVDGKEMAEEFDPESIDPENIKSIAVLKADSAVEKYGEKAKAGVIEITLKNKEQD